VKKIPAFIYLSVPFLAASVGLQARILSVTVNGPIHPVTAEIILKALEKARDERASLLIIKLNTPGGLDSSMREIIEGIVNSPVPVVAYVIPPERGPLRPDFHGCGLRRLCHGSGHQHWIGPSRQYRARRSEPTDRPWKRK